MGLASGRITGKSVLFRTTGGGGERVLKCWTENAEGGMRIASCGRIDHNVV